MNRSDRESLHPLLSAVVDGTANEGQVAEFIEHEELGSEVLLEFDFESLGGVGGDQVVQDVDGGGEEDRVAALAGLVAQGNAQMRFTQTATRHQNGVGLLLHEAQAEEVFDLHFVDLGGPVPAETIECFQDRETGRLNAPRQRAFLPTQVFAVEQALEIVGMRPLLFGGLLGQRVVVLGEIR